MTARIVVLVTIKFDKNNTHYSTHEMCNAILIMKPSPFSTDIISVFFIFIGAFIPMVRFCLIHLQHFITSTAFRRFNFKNSS